MMRAAFERRGQTMHSMLSAIDGVTCLEPQGAFYCFPNVEGLLGRGSAAGATCRRRSSSPTSCCRRPRWRSCPARRSARPGYARFSFALGDDDLVEGITRLADLAAS